jgi:hypothetical protein
MENRRFGITVMPWNQLITPIAHWLRHPEYFARDHDSLDERKLSALCRTKVKPWLYGHSACLRDLLQRSIIKLDIKLGPADCREWLTQVWWRRCGVGAAGVGQHVLRKFTSCGY